MGTWVPCGKKLTCEYPGVMLKYGSDTMFDKEVSVLEMDGEFSNLAELCYIENQLQNTDSKFNGELTQSMVNNKGAPGSNNGSGFFQAPGRKVNEARILKFTIKNRRPT